MDEALAHAINSMHLEQEFVPREWYERLWRDFRIIDEDREIVRARLRTGLTMWRVTLIGILILALIYFLNKLLF